MPDLIVDCLARDVAKDNVKAVSKVMNIVKIDKRWVWHLWWRVRSAEMAIVLHSLLGDIDDFYKTLITCKARCDVTNGVNEDSAREILALFDGKKKTWTP